MSARVASRRDIDRIPAEERARLLVAADDLLRAPITDARLDAAFDRAVAKALAARRPRTWTDAQVEAAARVLYKLDVEADWRGAGVASRRWYTGAVRAVLAAAEEARDA